MISNDRHWPEVFSAERERLLAALGALTDEGVIESIQHIGATSVPGLAAHPCVDIGLAVWPFPLEPPRREALEALGYEPVPGYEGAPEQRFRHAAGTFQLHLVEAGSELWTDYGILRGYLAHDERARQALSARKQSSTSDAGTYRAAKDRLFPELLTEARRWWVSHHGFGPVQAVAEELSSLPIPWHVSSGWALDLFLGRVTRVHHDLDVLVSRQDQLALQQHMTGRGWKFVTYFEDRAEPWPAAMRLELPRHQVHAHRDGALIDFLFSEIQDGIWRFRRNPAVLRSADRLGLTTPAGIPYLAPEIALLFKSSVGKDGPRDKDQADFENVQSHLDPERRAWLRWALTVVDPGHGWLERLV